MLAHAPSAVSDRRWRRAVHFKELRDTARPITVEIPGLVWVNSDGDTVTYGGLTWFLFLSTGHIAPLKVESVRLAA